MRLVAVVLAGVSVALALPTPRRAGRRVGPSLRTRLLRPGPGVVVAVTGVVGGLVVLVAGGLAGLGVAALVAVIAVFTLGAGANAAARTVEPLMPPLRWAAAALPAAPALSATPALPPTDSRRAVQRCARDGKTNT